MGQVVLQVTLDTGSSANPNVGLDSRNKQAVEGDTIKWQSAGSGFTMTSLEPNGAETAFSSPTIGGNGQYLQSTYQPPDTSSGKKYPYTLTVTASDGTTYNTTERETVPDNGRPVIRN